MEALDGDRCRFETWVDSYEWLAVHVAVLGLDFTIDRPAEFRTAARTMSHRPVHAGG